MLLRGATAGESSLVQGTFAVAGILCGRCARKSSVQGSSSSEGLADRAIMIIVSLFCRYLCMPHRLSSAPALANSGGAEETPPRAAPAAGARNDRGLRSSCVTRDAIVDTPPCPLSALAARRRPRRRRCSQLCPTVALPWSTLRARAETRQHDERDADVDAVGVSVGVCSVCGVCVCRHVCVCGWLCSSQCVGVSDDTDGGDIRESRKHELQHHERREGSSNQDKLAKGDHDGVGGQPRVGCAEPRGGRLRHPSRRAHSEHGQHTHRHKATRRKEQRAHSAGTNSSTHSGLGW